MRNLHWWEYTLIGLFLFYAIAIILYMRNVVLNKLKYLDQIKPESEYPENYRPFVRSDKKNWNLFQIYFCAVFLLPIRLILFITSVLLISFISFVYDCTNPTRGKQDIQKNKFSRAIYTTFLRIFARLGFLSLGVWWIPKKNKLIQNFEENYPTDQYKNKQEQAPIFVANHVGYMEIVYFLTTKYCPSFVAKEGVSKLPLIGNISKSLQCIFVNRDNNKERNTVLESINQRCDLIKQGKKLPPVVIFPEGTVSNGKQLLNFKKGSFAPQAPLKIFIFNYKSRNFHGYLDSIPLNYHFFLTLCQFANSFDVTEFDTYYPDHLNLKNENDWELYSNQIRQVMLKAGSFKNSSSGYRDVQDYHKNVLQVIKDQINSEQQILLKNPNEEEKQNKVQEISDQEQDIEKQQQYQDHQSSNTQNDQDYKEKKDILEQKDIVEQNKIQKEQYKNDNTRLTTNQYYNEESQNLQSARNSGCQISPAEVIKFDIKPTEREN